MKRPVATALGVALLGSLAVGCGDNRECLDYDTQVISTVHFINGKAVPGTSVVTSCVKYEDE